MKIKTGIIMMNMGGPRLSKESSQYLFNLFNDPEIIDIPFRKILAPIIAHIRGKELTKKYDLIGGGSPIHKWSHIQGNNMCSTLDKLSPTTAPHKHYICFRYACPFTHDAIDDALNDDLERLILFSQYPQFSCTTSGSSLNEIFQILKHFKNLKVNISVIDRWHRSEPYIEVFSDGLLKTLNKFPLEIRNSVPVVFTAHSIPISVVKKGDSYPLEIAATVNSVVKFSKIPNPYYLSWQSKVGIARWLEPTMDSVVENLIKNGRAVNGIVIAPVSFTSDHIETSYDIDIKLRDKILNNLNYDKLVRVPSFNDQDTFSKALAKIVIDHLNRNEACSNEFIQRCHLCTSGRCKESREFVLTNFHN